MASFKQEVLGMYLDQLRSDSLGRRVTNFRAASNPYKVKNLNPDYVKIQRRAAKSGNREAQRILASHNLSW